jgi:hypothetical protein
MPIDLRRFEQCSDQKRLYLNGYKDNELLERRLEVALALRRTAHSLRNQREQLVARRRKGLGDDDGAQAICLPELEEQVKIAAASLYDALWQLPNWIDSELVVGTNSAEKDSITAQSIAAPSLVGDCDDDDGGVPPPEDPLFCANCYEEMRSGAAKTSFSTTVLVGPGIRVSQVLHEYMVDGIVQALDLVNSAVTHWNLPPSIESVPPILDNDMAHYSSALSKATGEPGKTANESPPMDIPAWLTLLRNQSGTYWDRQLPRAHILSITATSATIRTKPRDDREAARIQSWSDRVRHGGQDAKGTTTAASLWHQRLVVSEQVQLLAVTGPSLEADSRPLQMHIMQQVRNLFQALLQEQHCHQHSSRHASSIQPPTVQLCAMPAVELLPMESSRLVVHGYLSSASRPVCLAYLSNLQDYCSTTTAAATASIRGCDLRHGTTKEGLHVLQGTICSLAEAMEWLSHHGARHHAIAVPSVLNERPGSALPSLLEYTRRVVIHPKGKRSIQDIVVPPANNTKSQSQSRKLGPTESTTQKGLDAPSIERIRGEALSSPFGFLPFHHQ